MPPMLNISDIKAALRAALPADLHPAIPTLAQVLTELSNGTLRGEEAQSCIATNADLIRILRVLAGQQVEVGHSLISFGSGAQMGDVQIGEVAGGNINHFTFHIAPHPSKLTPQERRNRQAMIQKVRAIWVDGLLKHSLAEVVRIELRLTERPDSIVMPLSTQYQELRQPPRQLSATARIIDVFDQMGSTLLILGAPGAGKTTLLLELCDALLVRAEGDETQPIPVIFNLSSWTPQHSPLEYWLVEELNGKYDVPTKIGHHWVVSDMLLPLLDGLDEVVVEQRSACVAALNTYRSAHFTPIAVCSRIADYETISTKVKLQGAILIQPLMEEQIDTYIHQSKAHNLQVALQHDPELRELASTPLMLNVLALAYTNQMWIRTDGAPTATEQRHDLLNAYIIAMFRRRTLGHEPHSHQQLIHQLRFLARQNVQRTQPMFLIERLQPDWLPHVAQRRMFTILVFLALCIPASMLFGIGSGLPITLGTHSLGVGSISGLMIGIACSLTLWLAVSNTGQPSWVGGLLVGGLFGWAFGLSSGMSFGANVGIKTGLAVAIITSLAVSVFSFWQSQAPQQRDRTVIAVAERLHWSWQQGRVGTLIGFPAGSVFGAVLWFLSPTTLDRPLGIALSTAFGLIASITLGLIAGLMSERVESTIHPNQGIINSIRNAVTIGLIITGACGLILGIAVTIGWGAMPFDTQNALAIGVTTGLCIGAGFGFALASLFGGYAGIQHYLLRILLSTNRIVPFNIMLLLENAANRILIRRVGGGYIFIHRLLMEHFAAMTEEDIAQLSAEIEAGRGKQ